MFCVGFVVNLICVVGVNLTQPRGHLLPSLLKKGNNLNTTHFNADNFNQSAYPSPVLLEVNF